VRPLARRAHESETLTNHAPNSAAGFRDENVIGTFFDAIGIEGRHKMKSARENLKRKV
jgi:hypothetical protein